MVEGYGGGKWWRGMEEGCGGGVWCVVGGGDGGGVWCVVGGGVWRRGVVCGRWRRWG